MSFVLVDADILAGLQIYRRLEFIALSIQVTFLNLIKPDGTHYEYRLVLFF